MSSQAYFRQTLSAAALIIAAVLLGGVAGCQSEQTHAKDAAFWPPYPDEPHVQYLRSIEKSADIQPPKTSLEDIALGKEPQKLMLIKSPYGVKMWEGRIYVCDNANGAVEIFDLRKKQVFVLGKGQSDAMVRPSDIAIAPDGTKYVADAGSEKIYVYDRDDRFLTTFSNKKLKPVAVAVYENELFACDLPGQRIVVLNRTDGTILRTIGGPGSGRGQFIKPIGLAVDAKGNIYVTDLIKCELQKFDRSGKLLLVFGERGDNIGALARPKQVAVDRDGYIYIVDAAFDNVQIFNSSGRLLTFFGMPGPHLGSMDLPAGISICETDLDLFSEWVHPAFQPERLILVTNQDGPGKIAIYALGKLKPGKTVADIRNNKGLVPNGLTNGVNSSPLAGAPTTMPSEKNPFGPRPASTQPAVFGPVLVRPATTAN